MQFYFIDDNKRKGPFTIDELKSLEFNGNTLFWHEGLDDWTEAKKIKQIKKLLKPSKIFPLYSKGFIRLHFVISCSIIIYVFGNITYINHWDYLFTNKVKLDDTIYYDDAIIYLGIYLCLFILVLPALILIFNWIKDGFLIESKSSIKKGKLSKRQKVIFTTVGSALLLFVMFYLITSFYLPNYYYEKGECKKANSYYKILNSGKYKECSSPWRIKRPSGKIKRINRKKIHRKSVR